MKRSTALLALCLLASAANRQAMAAREIPPVPKLKTFHTAVPIAHDGSPDCIIAVPAGKEYAALGQRLAEFGHCSGSVGAVVHFLAFAQ